MIVTERYHLPECVVSDLQNRTPEWGYGMLSQVVFYRTYSRQKKDGSNEHWWEVVQRCVEGVLSIRKWWLKNEGVHWDQEWWDYIGAKMADYMFDMKFLPPGRGLWVMGTDYVFNRGSAALNNCGFVDIRDIATDSGWLMDHLMLGVGVGFSTYNAELDYVGIPEGKFEMWTIPDSREGWVESVVKTIQMYTVPNSRPVIFNYSEIRPYGSVIHGFGGIASGPKPLQELHKQIREEFVRYIDGGVDKTELVANIQNMIGACVIAGNVRRSAEIALGLPDDTTFANLKNYDENPHRAKYGWMSNNSIVIESERDRQHLTGITDRILDNGEPGIIMLDNIRNYLRFGHNGKYDTATGINPCAEIPLESYELCNLVEIFPTKCDTDTELYTATMLATIYASTVSLLPSHDMRTNEVVQRNRRIGVSLTGVTQWVGEDVYSRESTLDTMYSIVQNWNQRMNNEANVPHSIRTTTIKPSGTVSLLGGTTPGGHYGFGEHVIRRIRIANYTSLAELLKEANVPFEGDLNDPEGTLVFSFPMITEGDRGIQDTTVWEKFEVARMLQTLWADNSVSVTAVFNPVTEKDDILPVLEHASKYLKAFSLLKDQSIEQSYEQAPFEISTKDEVEKLASQIQEIDFSHYQGKAVGEKFCTNEYCVI